MTFVLIRKHVSAALGCLREARELDGVDAREARAEARQLLDQARTVARARKPAVRSRSGLYGALTDVTDGGQVQIEGAHGVTMADVADLEEIA